jgi:3-oxoacyl-(acyl-carrier-protein) synthase
MDAWKDANLSIGITDEPDWDSGTIFGTGTSGIDKFHESIYKIDDFQTRRLGSTAVAQTMNSGVTLILGNWVWKSGYNPTLLFVQRVQKAF